MELEPFKATGNGELPNPSSGKPPRHRSGEPFIKGPIPISWLGRAAALPGKSLHVGLALWYVAGLTGKRRVQLRQEVLGWLGLAPSGVRRSLIRLESAGLVSLDRKRGRRPIVTIQSAPAKESST